MAYDFKNDVVDVIIKFSVAVLGYNLTNKPAFNSNLNNMQFHPDVLKHQVLCLVFTSQMAQFFFFNDDVTSGNR